MAKKDFTSTEDITLSSGPSDGEKKAPEKSEESEKGSETGHTEVKNAHAAGDGSFGRSEKLLSDEGEGENGESVQNPPY